MPCEKKKHLEGNHSLLALYILDKIFLGDNTGDEDGGKWEILLPFL